METRLQCQIKHLGTLRKLMIWCKCRYLRIQYSFKISIQTRVHNLFRRESMHQLEESGTGWFRWQFPVSLTSRAIQLWPQTCISTQKTKTCSVVKSNNNWAWSLGGGGSHSFPKNLVEVFILTLYHNLPDKNSEFKKILSCYISKDVLSCQWCTRTLYLSSKLCTNYKKHSGLKQHPFIVSQFLCTTSLGTANWVFCSGFHQTEIKVSARLEAYLRLEVLFQDH